MHVKDVVLMISLKFYSGLFDTLVQIKLP